MATKRLSLRGGLKTRVALEAIAAKVTQGGALKVGFLEGVRYSDTRPTRGTPRKPVAVAQVAFWNEFGTKKIPPRPFFRTTIKEQSSTWGDKLGKAVVFFSYNGRLALSAVGRAMVVDLRAQISRWSTPPNAAYTISIKKFDKPLIDDGYMQRSVDFKVGDS